MTSTEVAFLMPVAVVVVMVLFQAALFWHASNAVVAAADMGFDAGRVHPDDPELASSEARAASQWLLDRSGALEQVRVAVDPAAGGGNRLTVTVEAHAPRIVPFGRWSVRSVAEGRYEAFVTPAER